MIRTERISIKRSFVWPSFSWVPEIRKRPDRRSRAERAFANRRREAFANARRDAAHAEFFLTNYRI